MRNSSKATAFAAIAGAIFATTISVVKGIAERKDRAAEAAEHEVEQLEENSEPETNEESEVEDEPEPTFTADVEDAE